MYDREVAYRSMELVLLSKQGVPCLIGNTGVGKTDMVKQLAEMYKKNLVVINTSVMNADDLAGYPYLDKKSNKMKWGIPDWFPTEKDSMIFLDEFNRADKQVINALMPLLLSGELHHGAKLPEDTWIVVAMNPDSEDYDMVNSFDDLAISSRLVKLVVNNDGLAWSDWAERTLNNWENRKDYRSDLIKHMRTYIDYNNTSINIEQLPNNRSFTKAIGMISYVLDNCKLDYFTVEVVLNALKGILGVKYVLDNKTFFVEILTSTNISVYDAISNIIDENYYDSVDERTAAIESLLTKAQSNGSLTEDDLSKIVNKLFKDQYLSAYNRTILTSLDPSYKLNNDTCVWDMIGLNFDELWNYNSMGE